MNGVTRRAAGASRAREWEAHVWYDGRQVHIGGFDDMESAIMASDLARILLRGKDAKLNLPASTYHAVGDVSHEEFDCASDIRARVRDMLERVRSGGPPPPPGDDDEPLVWTPSPRADPGGFVILCSQDEPRGPRGDI